MSDADAPTIGQPKVFAEAAPATASPNPSEASAPAAGAEGAAPPVYLTEVPPPATLRFVVTRTTPRFAQPLTPTAAELQWQTAGEHYTLRFGRSADGAAGISTGRLDAHGLAPDRQVDMRRGRELRAVNFDRSSGRITYSGPGVEHPLWPGAQDRVSWLLQLASIVAADPSLGQPGRRVDLWVAGPRGDAAPWTFTSGGSAEVALADGSPVAALHFQRRPDRPYDLQVDVWLDPARRLLPVRLRLQLRATGEASDFSLVQLSLP